MKKIYKYLGISSLFLFATLIIQTGCKKLVEVDPPLNSITSAAVFSEDFSAISALTGLYTQMADQDISTQSITGISFFAGLSADEIGILPDLPDNIMQNYYQNKLVADRSHYPSWSHLYGIANGATYAIEGLEAQETKDISSSSKLTRAVKIQLLGEAKFLRAFCYFYLVNFYGDVPLILNSSFKENLKIPRTPKTQVYDQIIKDLNEAKELLSVNFVSNNLTTTSLERVRPTRWAAAALLARAYLYQGNDYAKAEANASEVIANSELFQLTALDQTFLKNSKESIWQLQPVRNGWNTIFGQYFILSKAPSIDVYDWPFKPFYLNEALVNDFETGDPRKSVWTGTVTESGKTYHFSRKYRQGTEFNGAINSVAAMTEYITVLRLSEQYLIRAEARFVQNKLSDAVLDINAVRSRARNGNVGILPDITSSSADLKKAIAQERRVELFTEWGDRWLNLIRTGKINEVMSIITPLKSGLDWKPYQALYPIPQEEVLMNPTIIQNPGY